MSAVRTDAFGLVAITGLVDGGHIFLASGPEAWSDRAPVAVCCGA